jgi:predicted transcriptional regulator
MATKQPHTLVVRLMDLQRVLGLSGSEMARRLEVNPSTWTRLVSGDMKPSLRIVQATVKAFPELRPFCVQLLLISSDSDTNQQKTAEVA